MNKLRVLHIVPWFPNPSNKTEGIFIAEHIKALNEHCTNLVLHIQFGIKKNIEQDSFENVKIERLTLKPLVNKWILKEKIAEKAITKYLKLERSNFDVINFYITYPNAIGINKMKDKFPELKFCMVEQWSAFHTHFNLSKGSKGRIRIENIFNNNIPLYTVSKALGKDIQNFISNTQRKFDVIPNCINVDVFTFKEKSNREYFTFTSINNWSRMKNPFTLIEAFKLLSKELMNIKLVLAGDGVLIPEMKKLVQDLNLTKVVEFKGRVSKNEVATLLHNSNIYCQSSNYETFSAICIEALATGTPVVATNIGGMKDFINKTNGFLVDDLKAENWFYTLKSSYLNYSKFNKKQISNECIKQFNSKSVGKLFYSKLVEVFNE
jgi:glycosyltransferase involved in cell wall biosynthesis